MRFHRSFIAMPLLASAVVLVPSQVTQGQATVHVKGYHVDWAVIDGNMAAAHPVIDLDRVNRDVIAAVEVAGEAHKR